MIKKILFITMIAASMGSIATPALADVYVRVAPPALRIEAEPAPRHGYIHTHGYWAWRHGRHTWVAGSWMRERHGYHYVEPQWADNHDGRWHMQAGHWDRD